MSCCGGTCSCGCGMCLSFTEENTSSTPESMILGVAPKKGAGEAAPEKASESGEAGQGCCCGAGCTCSPCSC